MLSLYHFGRRPFGYFKIQIRFGILSSQPRVVPRPLGCSCVIQTGASCNQKGGRGLSRKAYSKVPTMGNSASACGSLKTRTREVAQPQCQQTRQGRDMCRSFQPPGVRVMPYIVPQVGEEGPKANFIPTMITFNKYSSLLMVLSYARIYDQNCVVTCHSSKFII